MRLALAGDTMLGRGVADALLSGDPRRLVDEEVAASTRAADLFVLNLECAVSDRGSPWPDPDKPFFFRAPPRAVRLLTYLGVSGVTLANNHALDFGPTALLDTLDHLHRAGIATVGAGRDLGEARAPMVLSTPEGTVGVIGVTDHPYEYGAGEDSPGVAFADLRNAPPAWPARAIAGLGTDVVLVTPHWGPNMVDAPVPHVRAAAAAFLDAGATLVAGHSAHVFHGVGPRVLYDLGDFLDDYAVDPGLRNDLGMLFFVDIDRGRPRRVEAVPLALDYCHTRLATGSAADWVAARFIRACAALGTRAQREGDRLVVDWPTSAGHPDPPGLPGERHPSAARAGRGRGHRSLPHTADVILRAWGPDLPACLEEAVAALVGTYAARVRTGPRQERELLVPAGPAEGMLLHLLEEVIVALDCGPGVPVGVRVTPVTGPPTGAGGPGDAGLRVTVILADPGQVVSAGAVPKAVSRSQLEVREEPGAVSCQFLVDV